MLIRNNRVYDTLKYIAQIVLPGLGALYFALAQIWGLPNVNEVAGTILAVDTFLGVLLGLSSAQYNNSEEKYDGTAAVDDGVLKLNVDPHDFLEKNEVLLKVKPPSQESGPGGEDF